MDFTGTFTYNMNNLSLVGDVNMIIFFAVAVLFLITTILSRYIFLWIAGVYLLYAERQKITKRKKILEDLVLMKDIQTELEKEIEQATLKAAFQS